MESGLSGGKRKRQRVPGGCQEERARLLWAVLTRTTTTCTDTCSGRRIGAWKCMASDTRRWMMDTRFLPWMAGRGGRREAPVKARPASSRPRPSETEETRMQGAWKAGWTDVPGGSFPVWVFFSCFCFLFFCFFFLVE